MCIYGYPLYRVLEGILIANGKGIASKLDEELRTPLIYISKNIRPSDLNNEKFDLILNKLLEKYSCGGIDLVNKMIEKYGIGEVLDINYLALSLRKDNLNKQYLKEKTEYIYKKIPSKQKVKWKSEYEMYKLIKYYYNDAIYQYRNKIFQGLVIDTYIPSKKIAFEYQGEQHTREIEIFQSTSLLDRKINDLNKKIICVENGIRLIEWKNFELINKLVLDEKINEKYTIKQEDFDYMKYVYNKLLKERESKRIYSISDICNIIEKYITKDSSKYLNNLNFNRLGYKVREQYVFKQSIISTDSYIKQIILKDDYYIESEELKKLGSTYVWTIGELLNDKIIFKINSNTYITKTGLEKKGIYVDSIKNTEKRIKDSFGENDFFNIYTLKKNKIIKEEDFCGFDEVFLENMLQYSKGIHMLKIDGNCFFTKSRANQHKSKFVNYVLNIINPIHIDDLLEYLQKNYNIEVDKYTILEVMDRNIFKYDIETKLIDRIDTKIC